MTRYKGKDGYIEAGGTPVEVAERMSWNVRIESEQLDANRQGIDWSDSEGGLLTASGSMEVMLDPADAGQLELAVIAQTAVTMSLYPMGDASGLTEITGDWLITSIDISSGVGDLVKATYEFTNKGTITMGTVT
jgi:hypothetical protein